MKRNKLTIIFITLGLLFALFSIPLSGALNQEKLERGMSALTADDTTGVLKLTGFNNPTLLVSNINKKYFQVGTITNSSKETINLTVTMTPDFSNQNNKAYWLGIMISSTTTEFIFGSAASAQVTLQLSPNQSINVQAALTNNQAREVATSYRLAATNLAGTYTATIADTVKTPRRMTYK